MEVLSVNWNGISRLFAVQASTSPVGGGVNKVDAVCSCCICFRAFHVINSQLIPARAISHTWHEVTNSCFFFFSDNKL